MDWYEDEVRGKERMLARVADIEHRVPFYGSSSIRLWENLTTDFPRAVNVGFGGSTLVACAWFFNRLIVPLKPKRLLLYAGDNDIGDGCSMDAYRKRLDDMLNTIEHFFPALPITWLTIKASPARKHLMPRIIAANDVTRERLERRGHAKVIDVFSAMRYANGDPDQACYTDDGLHMSATGYRVWRRLIQAEADWVFGPER